MADISTELLIRRCQEGNMDAFSELMALYQNKVYSFCLHMTGNHEDAQDLAQEGFIRIYRALHSFRGQSAFTTWAYRIVANLWSNEIRKRKKQHTVPLDAPVHTGEGEEVQRTLSDLSNSPEEELEAKEEKALVWQALSLLSEDQRTVIVLREMYGYSYDEIAASLNCSTGTIKSRLNRARQNLTQKLREMTQTVNMQQTVQTATKNEKRVGIP